MTEYLPENAKMRSDPALVSSAPHEKPVLKAPTEQKVSNSEAEEQKEKKKAQQKDKETVQLPPL